MIQDRRTIQEKRKGYPIGPQFLINRCTIPICGFPNSDFFELIHDKLIAYLNDPSLTKEKLIDDVHDAKGNVSSPTIYGFSSGWWLQKFPNGSNDIELAEKLINTNFTDWLDIIRIKGIGADTLYDLFYFVLIKEIKSKGICLFSMIDGSGTVIDNEYFQISSGRHPTKFIKIKGGIPYEVQSEEIFILPTSDTYNCNLAVPKDSVLSNHANASDSSIFYKPSELTLITNANINFDIDGRAALIRIGFSTNLVKINHTKVDNFSQISLHLQKSLYPSNQGKFDTFSNFIGYKNQHELENFPVRGKKITKNDSSSSIMNFPVGKYKVAFWLDDIIVSTKRDLLIDDNAIVEVSDIKDFDLKLRDKVLPVKSFLQGDIIPQSQGSTNWCGPYSLYHACSYWFPHIYNPRHRNGAWFSQNIKDVASTWLHTVADILTFGLTSLAIDIFAHDRAPGTLQVTLEAGARALGFSSETFKFGNFPKQDALKELKKWIYAGVPVIVAVDELMDKGDGYFGGEHYKVLVGFDDNAVLDYTNDDGTIGSTTGAFYFINSGLKGENRDNLDVLPRNLREDHSSYDEVPIGNDVDSYDIFWEKWKTGGLKTFTDNYWCLPIYPKYWSKLKRIEKSFLK